MLLLSLFTVSCFVYQPQVQAAEQDAKISSFKIADITSDTTHWLSAQSKDITSIQELQTSPVTPLTGLQQVKDVKDMPFGLQQFCKSRVMLSLNVLGITVLFLKICWS